LLLHQGHAGKIWLELFFFRNNSSRELAGVVFTSSSRELAGAILKE
jgi:hypothetical protein